MRIKKLTHAEVARGKKGSHIRLMGQESLKKVDCLIKPESVPKVLEQASCEVIGGDCGDLWRERWQENEDRRA